MSRASGEAACLDWDEFRALEYFAIAYDIAIDEEQYNPRWCHIESASRSTMYKAGGTRRNAEPWVSGPYLLFPHNPQSPGDLPDTEIEASFDGSQLQYLRALKLPNKLKSGRLQLRALESNNRNPISCLWRKLLLSKTVRAELQENGSTTALDALDKLGISLLRAMPLLEHRDESHNLQTQFFILKVLFLTEAAACYMGYKSISLAEDALNLIKSVGVGETPYELVALYTKGQGHLHILDHDNALRTFEAVAAGITSTQNRYFSPGRSRCSHLRWPGQRRLFDTYVGYPSVLQCAETLLNMQRSWEAQDRFLSEQADRTHFEPRTEYQKARRHILIERITNDRELSAPQPNWLADGIETHNLSLQRLSVESERAFSNCHALIAAGAQEDIAVEQTLTSALLEFERAAEKLRNRTRIAASNRSEVDDVCFSWVTGLSICRETLSLVASVKTESDCSLRALKAVHAYLDLRIDNLILRDVAAKLCVDTCRRNHADEIRKTLVDGLSRIQDLRQRVVKAEGIRPGIDGLLETAADYFSGLLTSLIRDRAGQVPKIEELGWREQQILLAGKLLPDGRDSTARHDELRAFISHAFVHPTEPDLSGGTARLESERKMWQGCKANHRCLKDGSPTLCGGKVLLRNPSFAPQRGSNVLHHVDRLIQQKRQDIDGRLYEQREHGAGWRFVVLQRWNSFTPAMSASEGGGYFLFHADETDKGERSKGRINIGVVIDPGYGFVKNFVSEGFGVLDVTAIVITHDHPDHLADVESLVNLLFEVGKNRGGSARKRPRIEMLLSRGAFEHLGPLIESSRRVFRDTVVLEPGTEYTVRQDDCPEAIRIRAHRAFHRDASHLPYRSGYDSVALVGEILVGIDVKAKIGIPSDTKWDAHMSREFTTGSPCDLICLHLDSIMPEHFRLVSYFDAEKTSREVLHQKQQLYLPGVIWYLNAIKRQRVRGRPRVVVLSEFGEELAGGMRIDIARRLQAYTHESVIVLPGDVGLCIDPIRRTIRCSCCRLEHSWTTPFHCETSGASEQILYVCPWCVRNFTQQERAEMFSGGPALPESPSRCRT